MQGYSLTKWPWFKLPDAIIQDSLIIPGEKREPYFPGEDTIKLLNAVREIEDEKSALEFVKKWGLLGIKWNNIIEGLELQNQIIGATKFALAMQEKQKWKIDIDKEISEVFYPEGKGEGLCLMPEGDSLLETIKFAQWVRYIAKAKRLLGFYHDNDPCFIGEAEKWIFQDLSEEWQNRLIGIDISFLEKQCGSNQDERSFYNYILEIILSKAKDFYFGYGKTGIRIELFRSPIAGNPQEFLIFRFDGLFRFIAYFLLVSGEALPKKCEDPDCNEIFFPFKADQKYCPPPSGKKRSLCEMRHSKKIARGIIKEYQSGRTIEELSKIYGKYRDVEQIKKIIENSLKKKASQ